MKSSSSRVLALLLLTACGTTDAFTIPTSRTGPYDALPERSIEKLREVQADWGAGQLRIARAGLLSLLVGHPRNIPLGILLQELEIETLERGRELVDMDIYGSDVDWDHKLMRWYRQRTDQSPTPERLVLAARLETDGPSARVLLERAVAIDPECAWAHYGLAHLAFQAEDFAGGRAGLERAIQIDPGNLAARRLQTRTLAHSAKKADAIRALELWHEVARDDPFVRPRELAEAELDLAILCAEVGRTDEVEDLCASLISEGIIDRAPVYLVLAASRISAGDSDGALDAASRASRLAPLEALAHVQRALVLEDWEARPEKAYEAWVQALEAARGTAAQNLSGQNAAARPQPATVRDAQLWLQARTRLERLERRGIGGPAPFVKTDAVEP